VYSIYIKALYNKQWLIIIFRNSNEMKWLLLRRIWLVLYSVDNGNKCRQIDSLNRFSLLNYWQVLINFSSSSLTKDIETRVIGSFTAIELQWNYQRYRFTLKVRWILMNRRKWCLLLATNLRVIEAFRYKPAQQQQQPPNTFHNTLKRL